MAKLSPTEKEAALLESNKSIAAQFPDVPTITPAELKQLLEGPDKASIVVVDVRSDDEVEVSVIESPLTLTSAEFQARKAEFKDFALVVVYCTVGFRSAKYAAQLIKEGFSNVKNLEGSIVGWTQVGGALETRAKFLTNKVHAWGPTQAAWVADDYEAVVNEQDGSLLGSLKGKLAGLFGNKSAAPAACTK